MSESKTAGTKRGSYRSGVAKQKMIIEATRELLIEEGYHNFSIRRVAKRVGISSGNLQYYFASKDELFEAMVTSVIGEYLLTMDELKNRTGSPEDYLFKVIQFIMRDLTTFETTRFFPELWSLGNHDQMVDKIVQNMYVQYREIYAQLAVQINPQISTESAEKFALFLSSCIEGHAIFIGHNKQYTHECDHMIDMMYATAIHLLKSRST